MPNGDLAREAREDVQADGPDDGDPNQIRQT
jgi:hypothetical protein